MYYELHYDLLEIHAHEMLGRGPSIEPLLSTHDRYHHELLRWMNSCEQQLHKAIHIINTKGKQT